MYVKYELVETRNSSSNILFEETIIGSLKIKAILFKEIFLSEF